MTSCRRHRHHVLGLLPEPGPIVGADGVTFEIAWDDDDTFAPVVAADAYRPGQRHVRSCA